MKKNIIKGAAGLFVALTVLVIGCKDEFLEIAPTGTLSRAQLTSAKGIDGSLIAAYSQVNGRNRRMGSASNWVWGSIRGGEHNKGTDPGDFSDINPIQRYEYLPTQGVINEAYTSWYEGVARCNNVMALLQDADEGVSDDFKTGVEAQARFLRAHFYFQLKINFDDTPYIDETIDYGTGIDEVGNDQDLWPKIMADMQFAYDNLPETQDQAGRVNKTAAAAYLGKINLYQNKHAAALTLFNEVITSGKTSNGKTVGLVAAFPDIFKAENDNHEESIWAYQSAANTGSVNNANPEFDLNWPYNTGANGPGNCCGFFAPTFELANHYRTDASGLPLFDRAFNSPANEVKTDQGLQSDEAFTEDAGNLDPRIDFTIGRRGIPYLDWQEHPGFDWIRNQANAGPYSPKKYVYYKTDVGTYQDNSSWTPGYAAMNINIIRFADVLLMAAECEIEVGSLEKAREYVNMVRERAANDAAFVQEYDGSGPAANYVIGTYDTPWTDKTAAEKAVRMERKLELAGEGQRFYDLVRWGIAAQDLNAYLAYESKILINAMGGASFDPKDVLLPLPQGQIDLMNGVLVQNTGY
ncbi:RagB/SusD family nutrient uptake outer membrane protein [Imperialibacter roseus]|uniref:RagB/SusD family nutrient uptake outer membrane protein n=1 Tax=Imperialibacter roseus TaxID=1324217 RepID=A0ABZ0IKS1_9BACT|nr:RagB/SusD family nutrient uptake outer membrane protein [Imperialibacter roseus]WOK05623.1 RagB/SusD family nutrient uptake outer membrane protein [Imperialibacter roseus]